jgi:hypothetical protein
MTAPVPPPTDLKSTLEEMRASVAARARRNGIAGAIQEAIVALLSVLLSMLDDYRAGRLPPIAPVAAPAGGGVGVQAATTPTAQPVPVIPAQSPGQARGGIRRVGQHLAEPALQALPGRCSGNGAHWIPACAGMTGTHYSSGSFASGFRAVHEAATHTQPVPVIPAQAGIQRVGRRLAEPVSHARSGGAAGKPGLTGTADFPLRASRRPPRCKITTDCDRAQGPFFKNASAGEGTGAALSFQRQNNTATAQSCSIFS